MTYLDGMDWAAAQQADQSLKNTWAEVITRFTDGNYRHANLMHNDPHPGNYRFHPDGTVGIVDFGGVKVLPEPMRRASLGSCVRQSTAVARDLRDCMVRAGFITEDSPLTAKEAHWYWSQVFYEMAAAPQPVTYAADSSGAPRIGYSGCTTRSNPLTRMNAPGDLVFAPRIHTALSNRVVARRPRCPHAASPTTWMESPNRQPNWASSITHGCANGAYPAHSMITLLRTAQHGADYQARIGDRTVGRRTSKYRRAGSGGPCLWPGSPHALPVGVLWRVCSSEPGNDGAVQRFMSEPPSGMSRCSATPKVR